MLTSSVNHSLTPAIGRESDGTWRDAEMEQFIFDTWRLSNSLNILVLMQFDWRTSRHHPTTFRAFSSLHALQQLVLSMVHFPSFGDLRCMLVSLLQLRKLTLHYSDWPPTPTPHMFASGPCHKRPAIEDLAFTGNQDLYRCSAEFFEWLALTQTAYSIRRVDFNPLSRIADTPVWPESCIHFSTVAAHLLFRLRYPRFTAGTCVNYWSVTNAYVAIPALDFLRLPISKMANLRELALIMDTRDPWRDLASALQQLPGTHLQRLTLNSVHIVYQSTDTSKVTLSGHSAAVRIDGDGLELLEPVLLEGKFKELKILEFESFTDDHDRSAGRNAYSAIALELHRKMPKLSASGVLRAREKPIKV